MIGLTDHELALAAHGAGQARLIIASIAFTNHLIAHDGMPPLGAPALRFSFPMPDGATDQERSCRLGEVAEWLGQQIVPRDGTYEAYRDFGGLSLGAHFTPRRLQSERTRLLLHGGRAA